MELMLYHPEHGYYGPAPRKIGRGGDFFTSVSVGPLYGRLLAQLVRQQWEKIGSPADFTLVEQGAHDGRLARDILDALDIPGARYAIVEPNPAWARWIGAGELRLRRGPSSGQSPAPPRCMP